MCNILQLFRKIIKSAETDNSPIVKYSKATYIGTSGF